METTETLNEIEQSKIVAFMEDKIMSEAVRKHLLSGLYNTGILRAGQPADARTNWAFQLVWDRGTQSMPRSNEELGADLRAMTRGIQLVEGAWEEMSKLKKDESPKDDAVNPAL